MTMKDEFHTILQVEKAADNDLNGLIAELVMHGYNFGIETDYDVVNACIRQVIYLTLCDKYAYAKAPCKLTIDYMGILLSLLDSVNQQIMNEAEA